MVLVAIAQSQPSVPTMTSISLAPGAVAIAGDLAVRPLLHAGAGPGRGDPRPLLGVVNR
jgi:hypothetical protein